MVEIVKSKPSALALLVLDGIHDRAIPLRVAESCDEEDFADVVRLQSQVRDGDGFQVIEGGGAWRVGRADEPQVRTALFALWLMESQYFSR